MTTLLEKTHRIKGKIGIASEIAKGNARLAYLAGSRSIDEGYQALRNAEDIFRHYYGRVIDDATLNKEEIMMLFIITVAGPVRRNRNQLYNILKSQYGSAIDENETIEKLYKLELIDWFEAEITKISDQSFGNFILYYVLYERHWVSIESFISIAFPEYKNKVVYVLRTIIEIFNSDEVVKFVENSIIAAWDNAPEGQEMVYLESFYPVDADKALYIIKKHIDQEAKVDFDLHGFDIDAKKNTHNSATKEIEILGGYKYTEHSEDAL